MLQASPAKKFQPSRSVVSFCTAVVIEVLGSITTVNTDVVQRILPFVISGLQPGSKGGSDHKVRFESAVFESGKTLCYLFLLTCSLALNFMVYNFCTSL